MAAGLGLTLVGVSANATAQTEEERAGARAVATEGAKAFEAGRWQEAVDLFTRAESLVHAPPHLLYMARAHDKLGNLVKAAELYNEVIREQLAPDAPEAFRKAQAAAAEEIKAVKPRLAMLTVKVQGAEAVTPTVTMDGTPVPPALVGVPRPVDPGSHQLQALADGWASQAVTVKLSEGGNETVVLELQPVGGAAGAGVPTPAGAAAGAGSSSDPGAGSAPVGEDAGPAEAGGADGLRIGSYVALGVGVVGLGAGTVFGLQSMSKRSDADEAAEACGTPCLKSNPKASEVDSLDDDARKAQTISTVGFIVGGAGIAAGVTMFMLSGSGEQQAAAPPRSTVRPWVGLGSLGVSGTF